MSKFFTKRYASLTPYTPDALEAVAEDVARFARKEGLEAHARSALVRSGQLTVDS